MAFSNILGQERAVNNLKQAWKKDKLHHAYLFCGPEGVGKTLTARELIKALNCDQPGPDGGCDRCPTCTKIERGIHPDFIRIRPEGLQIRIEQIRNLAQQLVYGPALGRSRLCLVDTASELNEAAANAFLKTLEEPPPATFLVLLVRDPGELLPTIVSRCLILAFDPLPLKLVEEKLVQEKGLDREEAKAFALLSEGSLGKAYRFLNSDFRRKQEDWFARLEELPGAGPGRLLSWAKTWTASREEVQELLEIGQWCLRDLIWIRLGLTDRVSLPPRLRERVSDLAFSQPEWVWLRRWHHLHQADALHRRNVNAQLNWEVLWLNLAASH